MILNVTIKMYILVTATVNPHYPLKLHCHKTCMAWSPIRPLSDMSSMFDVPINQCVFQIKLYCITNGRILKRTATKIGIMTILNYPD